MSLPNPLRRNIILIGFMGTGKSAVGQRVASSIGFTLVDTDELVESRAGKKITEIFGDSGEAEFRRLETEALREACSGEQRVISTGGGIVTIEENRQILEKAGYVLWLKASPESIYQRVRHNRERPLLRVADPMARIREMVEERTPLYEACADEEVNTTDLTLEETAHGVTETALFAFSQPPFVEV